MIPHNLKTWKEAFLKIIRSKKKDALVQALDEFKAETKVLIEQGFNELALTEILCLQNVILEKIDKEKSEACLDEMIKIHQDRATASARTLVNFLSLRALDELKAGRFDSGIKFADEALKYHGFLGAGSDHFGFLEEVLKEIRKWREKEHREAQKKQKKESPEATESMKDYGKRP
jgi:hypothetical protein